MTAIDIFLKAFSERFPTKRGNFIPRYYTNKHFGNTIEHILEVYNVDGTYKVKVADAHYFDKGNNLDDPTSGLDNVTVLAIKELLQHYGI